MFCHPLSLKASSPHLSCIPSSFLISTDPPSQMYKSKTLKLGSILQIRLCGICPSAPGLLFIFVCHLYRPQTLLVLAWSNCWGASSLQTFRPMDRAIESLFFRAQSWFAFFVVCLRSEHLQHSSIPMVHLGRVAHRTHVPAVLYMDQWCTQKREQESEDAIGT